MKRDFIIVIGLLILVVAGSIGIYYFTKSDSRDDDIVEVKDGRVDGISYRVGYLSDVETRNIDKVISKYDDFLEYFNTYTNHRYDGEGNVVSSSCDEILKKYDKEYFEDKSLAVKYLVMSSGSNTIKEVYGLVSGDKVKIRYLVDYPEVGTMDMNGFFLIIEVPKNVKKIDLN